MYTCLDGRHHLEAQPCCLQHDLVQQYTLRPAQLPEHAVRSKLHGCLVVIVGNPTNSVTQTDISVTAQVLSLALQVSHSSKNTPGLVSEGAKDVLADIWSDGKQVR